MRSSAMRPCRCGAMTCSPSSRATPNACSAGRRPGRSPPSASTPAATSLRAGALHSRASGDTAPDAGNGERAMTQQDNRPFGSHWSRRTVLGAALGAPFALSARADDYPSRPPHMIVPFAAGGPTDVLTRIAADQVGPRIGQQVIVESRTGAGGNIAAEYVARAPADGYTMLVAGQAIVAINKALYKKIA